MLNSEKILKKIGLSNNEIAVYIAGLRIGPSLASTLSRKTKISRTLVYHLLKSLELKGLVSRSGSSHGQTFIMEEPERLKSTIERKRKELEKVENQLEEVSAEIKSLRLPKTNPPQIIFYEGAEGLKNIAQQTLESKGTDVCALVPLENIPEAFDENFLHFWTDETNRRGIERRSIWTKPLKDTPFAKTKLRNLRIPPKGVNIKSCILIYGSRVAVISSSKEFFGFIIESEDYAETMKSMFETLWKISKPSTSK